MYRRRAVIGALGSALLAGCNGDGAGGTEQDGRDTPDAATETTAAEDPPGSDEFAVSTSAFADGADIPERFTADGADVSPPLRFEGVPDEAASLSVIVDDPDAPGGPFVHWLLWNVPVDTTEVPEDRPQTEELDDPPGARQGTNGFGELGYRGPSPPAADEAHTYRFRGHVLTTELDLAAGAERADLEDAMAGDVVATAEFTGEYGR